MTEVLWLLPGMLAGVAIGALVIWLRFRREREQQQTELDRRGQALATAQAERDALERQYQSLHKEWQELQARVTELSSDRARFEERHQAQDEKLAWLEQSREQLKKEFEHLAGKVLDNRGQQLQQQHRQGLDELLKPFREQMAEFRRRVDQIHTEESRTQAGLGEQLRQLQQLNMQMVEDARHLTNALKGQTKTQGNWGEMILERILEESGLTNGREYQTQVSINTGEGRRQPDVIVHLPDDKDVIIDAKVSLTAYERFCREEDEDSRRKALDEHVQSLRSHVRGLNRKDYEGLEGIQTLDFVLLFIPVEAAFLTAMEAAPGLYQEAYEQHIVLVSPTTLMVTLRTINNIWRHEYQSRNALEIADRAGRICDQISLLEESMDEVGQRLEQARSAWETGYNRLSRGRGNLLRQAHQLQDMGARARRNLPAPRDEDDDQE